MGDEGEDENMPKEWKIRQYYEQNPVQRAIVKAAQYREVAPTYPNGYGKRPDAINFPGDYIDLVDNGAVAFHGSVERWQNPLLIDEVSDHSDLRKGWDLVIDIDCDFSFELAKDTAELVVAELRQHGLENISVKFSGNRGFHIGIRSEAFPDVINDQNISDFYPELPRGVIQYLRNRLEDRMKEKVRERGFEDEMKTSEGEDPYQVSDIENNWGQRHLFRMPYSLHDSSWLVSVPIKPENISEFEKSDAKMNEVEFEHGFLDEFTENEGKALIVQAMDFIEKRREKKKKERKKSIEGDFERPDDALPEETFPPTINNILEGLEDGRKRALLILVNFFRTIGYEWNEVESKIWEWNEKNKEPLRESYVKSQLNWHRRQEETVPPPNYDSKGYYKDMQVYEGDNLEEKVSNPVSYAFRKAKGDSEKEEDARECPYCGKRYKRESYYKRHVRECQGDDVERVK